MTSQPRLRNMVGGVEIEEIKYMARSVHDFLHGGPDLRGSSAFRSTLRIPPDLFCCLPDDGT